MNLVLFTLAALQLGMALGPQPKTVKVTSKEEGGPEGDYTINEDDFDPEKHELAKGQRLSSQPAAARPRVGGVKRSEEEGADTSSSRNNKKP